MLPRRSITRKYRPIIEALEPKQLLSAGTPAIGHERLVQANVLPQSRAEFELILPRGTGKSIRIITS